MLSILQIPEKCIYNKPVPLEKIFKGENDETLNAVQSIMWHATLKPALVNVSAVKTDLIRYEEIQVFTVTLNDPSMLYAIARSIYKMIKYPCLLVFCYQEKMIFSTCQFNVGKTDCENNILRGISFSHWVYPEQLSKGAQEMIEKINAALNSEKDLYSIYTELSHAVQFFQLSGISKAHVDRLLRDLLGRGHKSRDKIMQYCTPYKKYAVTDESRASRYDKLKRTSNHTYSYDREDIWYCLLKYEPAKKVIIGRRYRDIDDLILSIDMKNEEYENSW